MKKSWIDSATKLFTKNGEAAILIGAFTPIPFKVFTIISGYFKFSIWKLLAYAALGRAVKFYAVGVIFYLYGRSSEAFITSYLTYLMGGIAILLFVAFYIKRKIQKKKQVQLEDTQDSLSS